MESLAIEAFKNYRGTKDLSSMVRRFADFSSRAVLQPIVDSSEQSRYVDGYLGPANSPQRQRAAKAFQGMLNKFNACKTQSELKKLFWS